MKRSWKRVGALSLAVLGAGAVLPTVAHADSEPSTTTVVVDQSNFGAVGSAGWGPAFGQTGTVELVDSPVASPRGNGALRLRTVGAGERATASTGEFLGLTLGAVDDVSYATFVDADSASGSVSLPSPKLIMQNGVAVTYEPYFHDNAGALQLDTWTTWDNAAAQRGWWSTAAANCTHSAPCTYDEIVTDLGADTAVREVHLGLGSGAANRDTLVDHLALTVDGERTLFDFDTNRTPAATTGVNGLSENQSGWYGQDFWNSSDPAPTPGADHFESIPGPDYVGQVGDGAIAINNGGNTSIVKQLGDSQEEFGNGFLGRIADIELSAFTLDDSASGYAPSVHFEVRSRDLQYFTSINHDPGAPVLGDLDRRSVVRAAGSSADLREWYVHRDFGPADDPLLERNVRYTWTEIVDAVHDDVLVEKMGVYVGSSNEADRFHGGLDFLGLTFRDGAGVSWDFDSATPLTYEVTIENDRTPDRGIHDVQGVFSDNNEYNDVQVDVTVDGPDGTVTAPAVVDAGRWRLHDVDFTAPGPYLVTADLSVDGQARAQKTRTITTPDFAPTIAIASPDGADPMDRTTVTVTGSFDDDGVDPAADGVQVRLLDDGAAVQTAGATLTSGTWSADLDFDIEPGAYAVEAVLLQGADTLASDTVDVTVPVEGDIDITSPAEGTVEREVVTIAGSAENNVFGATVETVTVEVDGLLAETDASGIDDWSLDVDFSTAEAGTYPVTARLYADGDEIASDALTLQISEFTYSLTIGSPADGATVDHGPVVVSGETETDDDLSDLSVTIEVVDADENTVFGPAEAVGVGDWALEVDFDLPAGAYDVVARLVADGEVAASETIQVDVPAPVYELAITGPADGATVARETLAVTGTTSTDDDDAVTSVTVELLDGDGTTVAPATAADGVSDWTLDMDFDIAGGDYTVVARFVADGDEVASDQIGVTVPEAAWSVVIDSPADGATVERRVVAVTGQAASNDGLDGATVLVELRDGETVLESASTSEVEAWTVEVDLDRPAGEYVIDATLTIDGEVRATDSVIVTVPEFVYTVTIDGPADGATVDRGPAAVTGSITTDDPDAVSTVTVDIDGPAASSHDAALTEDGTWSADVDFERAAGTYDVVARHLVDGETVATATVTVIVPEESVYGPDTKIEGANRFDGAPTYDIEGTLSGVRFQVRDQVFHRRDGRDDYIGGAITPQANRTVAFRYVVRGSFGERFAGDVCTATTDADGFATCDPSSMGSFDPRWPFRRVEVQALDAGPDLVFGTGDERLTRIAASFG